MLYVTRLIIISYEVWCYCVLATIRYPICSGFRQVYPSSLVVLALGEYVYSHFLPFWPQWLVLFFYRTRLLWGSALAWWVGKSLGGHVYIVWLPRISQHQSSCGHMWSTCNSTLWILTRVIFRSLTPSPIQFCQNTVFSEGCPMDIAPIFFRGHLLTINKHESLANAKVTRDTATALCKLIMLM